MFKLNNTIQNYPWGCSEFMTDKFGINNDLCLPMAELWIGAHPKASSTTVIDSKEIYLIDYIREHSFYSLGSDVFRKFGALPFLFKVLCADKALSIQVHPSKSSAEAGFFNENRLGIPLDSSNRNYKDPNHKPEMIYALTEFRAMNGFRVLSEIVELLRPVIDAHSSISEFIENPNYALLRSVFESLLTLDGSARDKAIYLLKSVLASQEGIAWRTIESLLPDYPNDVGLFMPLLLNVIVLQPGEAMFLDAETPHAYFKGAGLEIMANSDNVLRAGLTSKHIDTRELLANVRFQSISHAMLRTCPEVFSDTEYFPVPVDDFSFSVHNIPASPSRIDQCGPAIFFCIEGELMCQCGEKTLEIKAGESIFINATDPEVYVTGSGRLARAYTEL